MRLRRAATWTLRIALGVFALSVLAFAVWANGEGPKRFVEGRLAEALDREVSLETLSIEDGALEIEALTIGSPEPFSSQPLLNAGSVRLTPDWLALLRGHVSGELIARDVDVSIQKRGSRTNAHRLGRGAGVRERPPLDLDVTLLDARVKIEDLDRGESVVLDQIDTTLHLANVGTELRGAHMVLDAERIRVRGVGIDTLHVELDVTPDLVRLVGLRGRIGERGTLQGHAEVRIDRQTSWMLDVSAADVAIDQDVFGAISAFYPGFSGSPDIPRGGVALALSLEGEGLRSTSSVSGSMALDLTAIEFSRQSLMAQLIALSGRTDVTPGLDEVRVRGTISEGWFAIDSIDTEPDGYVPDVDGRVSLNGALDLDVELRPLLAALDSDRQDVILDLTSSLPVRVTGTVSRPTISPPRWAAVGSGLAGGLLHRLTSSAD